jgi:hypothetical protein
VHRFEQKEFHEHASPLNRIFVTADSGTMGQPFASFPWCQPIGQLKEIKNKYFWAVLLAVRDVFGIISSWHSSADVLSLLTASMMRG